MPIDDPDFSVRSVRDGTYVIDVVWPDLAIDRLGFFASPDDASRWVNDNREIWVRDRLGITIH
jgi:hypothetical protein